MATNGLHTFLPGEQMAVVFIAIAAGLSAIAISFVMVRLALVALRPVLQGTRGRRDSKEGVFFHTQLGLYAACLLVANFLSSVAGLIEISWAAQGGIQEDFQCTAQGALMQVGDFAGAYFTTIIAIHTFNSLVIRKRSPIWLTGSVVALGWLAAILMGTVVMMLTRPKLGSLYGNLGMWCWIRDDYPLAQFMLHYLPMFIAAASSAIFYSIIFLCLRGTLVIGQGIRLNLTPENLQGWGARLNDSEQYRHFLGAVVRSMLWYPFAYIVLLAPISASRLMEISGIKVSIPVFAGSAVISSLLGLVNVIILINTLRVLGPAYSAAVVTPTTDVESFFSPDRKPSPIAEKPPTNVIRPARSFPPPVSRATSTYSDGSRFPSSAASSVSGSRPTSPRAIPRIQPPTLSHYRSTSNMSDSSTQRLLVPEASSSRLGLHVHTSTTDSARSSMTAASLQRHIIPTNMFNNADPVTRPEPAMHRSDLTSSRQPLHKGHSPSNSTSSVDSLGLSPAPRRTRSPVQRMPSNESLAPSQPSSPGPSPTALVTVNLQPPTPSSFGSGRDSLLSLYTQRSPVEASKNKPWMLPNVETPDVPPVPRIPRRMVDPSVSIRPAVSAVGGAPPSLALSLMSPTSPGDGPSSRVASPVSPFLGTLSRGDTQRTQTYARRDTMLSEGPGLSSLAWASLVTNAAIGGSPERSGSAQATENLEQRREVRVSKIPQSLRPRTPATARANKTFFGDGMAGPSAPRMPATAQPTRTFFGDAADIQRVPSPSNKSVRSMKSVRTRYAVAGDPEATFRSGPRQRPTLGAIVTQQDNSTATAATPSRPTHKRMTSSQPGYI